MRGLYKILVILTIALTIVSCQSKPVTPQEIISSIPEIDSFKLIKGDTTFQQNYELWFKQNIDYAHPEKGTFLQRVIYSHKGFDKPTVVVLEGYTIWSIYASELCKMLDANQLIIEHRFFSNSRPKDSIPWSCLNIHNAATDQHRIIQAFKKFYHKKWLTTGISKGGQTTIFHRSMFPNDVDVSVPYVAPLNFSAIDSRVPKHLDTLGSPECHKKILAFQNELFKRKSKLMPMFIEKAKEKKWEFIMGYDSAYDLSVMEFDFALWQWVVNPCDKIPPLNSSDEEIFKFWNNYTGFTFFEEKSIANTRPFFYQALTQIGMYGYNADKFAKYTKMRGIVKFTWTMPKGYKNAKFDAKPMQKVNSWIINHGNNMMYLYGAQDAWSATAVKPGDKTNAVILFNQGMNHRTRIINYPKPLQDSIKHVLSKWMNCDVVLPIRKKTE